MAFTVSQIKAIQTKLKALGFYTGVIDGIFGPYTLAAVKAFQKSKGLLVDGIVGPVTAAALGLSSVLFPVTPPVTFEMGYFINRIWNPLEKISWTDLKQKGINAVYIRCAEENLVAISSFLPAIKAAGLKPYAWTWQGFTMTKETVAKGWNICADIERNQNLADLPEIKNIYAITKAAGKTFILCTKAEGTWDGDQHWPEIVPYCDYIMPMLYTGDYNKTVAQLTDYMKVYNTKYPGKVYPALETYVSDANPVAKSKSALNAEIAAVKPYCKGIGLFRYGISNFDNSTTPTPVPTSNIQSKIIAGTGKNFTNFTGFYNLVKTYCDYAYYFDGKYNAVNAVNMIIQDIKGAASGLNCVDYTQVGVKLAKEMGYTAVPYGIYCTTDKINHAIFQISGKEFTSPTWIDLAAAASSGYAIGRHWCSGALTKQPSWIPLE